MPTILRTLITLTLCVWFGVACRSPAPEPQPEPEPALPAPVKIDRHWLNSQLDLADAAVARDQLTYPKEGSAHQIYQHILTRYPDQQEALDGIAQLVERYIEMALTAVDRGQLPRARSMLARARIIDVEHPGIEPTQRQIRLISQAQRTTLTLAPQELSLRSGELAAQIGAFASTSGTCRYRIFAGSDRQGRWIYQSLRAGTSGGRPRAEVEIRRPAGIERLCFASGEETSAQE